MRKHSTSSFALFAICVLIWGTTWLAIKYQLGVIAPELSVALRFGVAALLLALYCHWRGLSLRFGLTAHLWLAAVGAAMYCVSYIFVYRAELYVVSGLVALGYSASPLLNMLGARLAFGERMTWRMTLAGLLGVAGITLLFAHEFAAGAMNNALLLGGLYTAAAVLASTVGVLVAQSVHNRKIGVWQQMAWGMGYGALFSLGTALALDVPMPTNLNGIGWPYAASLLYLSVFGSIAAFGAYLTLLARVGAAQSGYVGVMVPIVALVISALAESYTWTVFTVAGIALAVAGNVLSLRSKANP